MHGGRRGLEPDPVSAAAAWSRNPQPDSQSRSESWGTHCSCVAVRLGSGCASWGPSCLLLDSWFLPCRDPECWKGLSILGSGKSLAAHMADGSMHETPPTDTPEGHCPL